MAIKKGPTKGSGGKHRNKLKGYGPTPKAEDRVYHKAYKAKKAAERRQMADPRLAARRRVDKFASADTSDLVYGRNSVLEALRVGVPSSTLYIMSRIEHDDRTREIVKIAGMNGLHMLEADRLEMDRIARSGMTIRSRILFFSYFGCASSSLLSELSTSVTLWMNSFSCPLVCWRSASTFCT